MTTTPDITLTIYRDGLTPVVLVGFPSIEADGRAASVWLWAIGWKIEQGGKCVAESIFRRAK